MREYQLQGELLLIFADNITKLVVYVIILKRRSLYTPYSDQQRMIADSYGLTPISRFFLFRGGVPGGKRGVSGL